MFYCMHSSPSLLWCDNMVNIVKVECVRHHFKAKIKKTIWKCFKTNCFLLPFATDAQFYSFFYHFCSLNNIESSTHMEGKNPFFHTIYCFELKHFHCKYIPLILKPQFSVAKRGFFEVISDKMFCHSKIMGLLMLST